MYLGSFGIDDYVGIPAATHRFSSGAAYAPSVLTYSIYEEAGTTGIDEDVDMTPASPFDSVVGCYWVRRQLTTAAGFEVGKNYLVVVKATVDSVAAIQMHTFQVAAVADSSGVTELLTRVADAPAGSAPSLALTTGTIDSTGATASSFRTSLNQADDYWNDALILITSGALAGQVKEIGDFANANGVITLTSGQAFTAAPANGVTFSVINR